MRDLLCRSYFELSHNEVESMVQDILEVENYGVPETEEVNNGSYLTSVVEPILPSQSEIGAYRNTEESLYLHEALSWLCALNEIPPGRYLISVSW